MPQLRRDFEKWFKHKSALRHAGMWNDKPRSFDAYIPKEENVDIDRTRTPSYRALTTVAAEFALNFLQQR